MKSRRTQKLLDTLNSDAKEIISELLELGYKNGLNPQVHSALRTQREQDRLYAMGRSAAGKIVTNARGTPIPQSSHCYGVAVDIHFDNNKDGRAEWDMDLYQQLWEIGEKAGLDKKGLRWAGNWRRFKEGPHFEVTFGRSWRDLASDAGYEIPGYNPSPKPSLEPKKEDKPEKPKRSRKKVSSRPKKSTKKPTKADKELLESKPRVGIEFIEE